MVKYTTNHTEVDKFFGCSVPYSEPYWYQGHPSAYYNKSHAVFRKYVRDFVDRELMPNCGLWDEQGSFPADLPKKIGAAGLFHVSCRYTLYKKYGDKHGKPTFGNTGS